jgi:uncharacterized membrane protein HdeD (DUF308 family)
MNHNTNTPVLKAFRSNWGLLLALGIALIILGTLGLWMVISLTIVSILFLGVLLLVAGGAQLIDVIKSHHWQGLFLHAFIGGLYIIGGCLIIYDPVLASIIITAILAWVFIIIGISRLILAIKIRHHRGNGWLIVSGMTSLILGGLILMQWPISALWIIGLLVAIELIVNGWSCIFLALTLRKR